MPSTRRQFFAAGAGVALAAGMDPARVVAAGDGPVDDAAPVPHRPVVTPNGATLPFRVIDGVKVFHLTAEPVTHAFGEGLVGECYGYNGRVHGPTIEAVEGDRVRIYVTNRLPVPTTVHWHGIPVPSGMDGVGGLTQRPIEPGETFHYEFTLGVHGTFMYHSHHDEMVQMAMGLMGMFVVHPRAPASPPPDRDYVYLLSEWALRPGSRRPDPNEMTDFNVLTLNGKIFPDTEPMVARLGERVRVRFGNLSAMDHHPIHFHGLSFQVVATDGGDVPESARWPETTVLVPTGSTRTIELLATNPGDWAVHCHMTHHVMTQMGHGIPNLTGADASAFDDALLRVVPRFKAMNERMMSSADDESGMPQNSMPMMGGVGPFGFITMGGMFTLLKIRDNTVEETGASTWYQAPAGTQADVASPEQLLRDGITP